MHIYREVNLGRTVYKVGPRTEPWGTPNSTSLDHFA